MVRLTKIYTRGGDKGKTSLGNGERVAKHALRVEAYGAVDEANASLGLVRLHTTGTDDPTLSQMDDCLSRIQNDLFDLGADLCTPEAENPAYPPLRILAGQVETLEKTIDDYNSQLEPLNSFVLPGGSPAAAALHQARTITRRAERLVSALCVEESVNPQALCYLNRLSDLLFVLSRVANQTGAGDVLWIPGKNR